MQQNVAILQLSVVSSGLEVHGFGTGLDEHLADGNGILRARGPCLGCAVRETEGVILTCQRWLFAWEGQAVYCVCHARALLNLHQSKDAAVFLSVALHPNGVKSS